MRALLKNKKTRKRSIMTLSPLTRIALATILTASTVLADNPAPNNVRFS